MGTRTPNMSLYKPSNGETVYDPAFSAGLDNVDAHDHSGAPNRGVQIGTSGIQDGAITPAKLSSEIIAETTVQTTDATPKQAVSISVAESSSATIEGRFTALRDDTTEAIGGNFTGTFRRATASNVAQVNANLINISHNSSGFPYFQLIADGTTVSIRAVGEAGKTINWHLSYSVIVEPE